MAEVNLGKQILFAPEVAVTISAIVTNTGVNAGSDGKKIIKAGTPVGGTTNVLENRQTALVVTNDSSTGANSQGVVLHDVDVTLGATNCSLVIGGYVDLLKLDSSLTIDSTAKTALKRIVFIKGAK